MQKKIKNNVYKNVHIDTTYYYDHLNKVNLRISTRIYYRTFSSF